MEAAARRSVSPGLARRSGPARRCGRSGARRLRERPLPHRLIDLDDGLFFSGTLNMKAWLATAVVVLACVQVFTASWMYGKLPFASEPGWLPTVHKASGTLAFLISLPVVYHCLWALGFQDTTTRVLVHSLAGCFFYGAFVAKMLWLRAPALPRGGAADRRRPGVHGAGGDLAHELALVLRQHRFPRLLAPAARAPAVPILGRPDAALADILPAELTALRSAGC